VGLITREISLYSFSNNRVC